MQTEHQISSEIDRYPVRIINVQERDFSYREASVNARVDGRSNEHFAEWAVQGGIDQKTRCQVEQ